MSKKAARSITEHQKAPITTESPMGGLHRFELSRYREHYGLATLFETGTFRGEGVRHALDAGFSDVLSVEIVDEFLIAAKEQFADYNQVRLFNGHSVDVLDQVLPEIEGNVLFWLDAHFPGADGGLRTYDAEKDETVRCPLEAELRVIKRHRAGSADVILIDDLRLYEDGPFENGPLPSFIDRPAGGGLDFVEELFGESHHVLKLFYDEGYVLLLPIDEMPKIYVRGVVRYVDGEIGRLLADNDELKL